VQDLDLIGLARAFGLLRLPRMPELKDRDLRDWEDADVDVSSDIACNILDFSMSTLDIVEHLFIH
jgi:hypothetical protein